MIMAVIAAMCFTACGKKAQTLEAYINDHPEVQTEIDEKLGTDELKNVSIEFKENEMIYNFDLAGMDDVTEELAKSDAIKESLEKGLDQQSETFVNIANTIMNTVKEDGAEIDTVKVTVNYKYGDELITTKSFEASADAAATDDAADDADDAEDDADEEAEG